MSASMAKSERCTADGGRSKAAKTVEPPQNHSGVVSAFDRIAYRMLRLLAECFDDFQKVRIACENRLLAKRKHDRGGEMSSRKRQPAQPRVLAIPDPMFVAVLSGCRITEKRFASMLAAQFRATASPAVLDWIASSRGIGEHTVARLLGHLGHPRIATPYRWTKIKPDDGHRCDLRCGKGRHLVAEPPFLRTIGQLRSYCGVGDPRRARFSGMSQEDALACGSPRLKMLLYLLASACVRTTPPTISKHHVSWSWGGGDAVDQKTRDDHRRPVDRYRRLYDAARIKYADRVHATECRPCGTKRKPAAQGTSWRLGHQHGAALRLVAKQILTDLWLLTGSDVTAREQRGGDAAGGAAAG